MHSTPEVEGRFRWWDEALRRAYFAQPGKPCVLAVDGDELARMAPDLEDAAADLTRAVRRVAGIPSSSDYFPGTTERYEKWKKHGCEGLPPVLPLLALSVLAATRMHGSGPYSRSNYYIRLSELLAAAGAPGSVEEIRYQVQRRFGSVAGMWRDLHEYLRRHPEHGESTIREHPSLTIIGYPLSQALVRKSDRAVLTHFFSKLALGAQRDIPGDSLLATLRLWASRPRGFSDPFVRAIRDDEVKALVLPIVLGLMHSWDGRVLGPEGRSQVTARLAIDPDRWSAWWVVEAVAATGGTVKGTVGGRQVEVQVSRREGETYATLGGLPGSSGPLCRSGFELRSDGATVVARRAGLVFFAEDPALGAWLSRDSMSPYEEHIVAASADVSSAFREALETAAEPGWRELRQRPESPLMTGYVIYRRVRFSRDTRLDAVVQKFPSLATTGLRPDDTVRARLVNGLRVAREMSSNCYLIGGAPDLLLPSGPESRRVTVTLDGATQQFRATGFPIPLCRVRGLEPGPHTVQVEGQTLTFHLVKDDPAPEEAIAAEGLGWDANGSLSTATADTLARGAVVAGVDILRPVFPQRRQDETAMIHRDGRWQHVSEPGCPAFLDGHVPPSPRFELLAPPSAVWLVERRGARWRVHKLAEEAPAFSASSLSTTDRESWRRLVGNGPEHDTLWWMYLQAAGVDA
ncbi:hypothetical protein [Cellulomonas denverensis]|uniref:Uncharacterized protein n=1 Tax=Cellulomonas denverensis TaxID=264297 RepID=A0A7X6KUU5_9CELL|nr:hypothetical protein [Cellulomonas denverensis]NKY22408.1 hypothetical protein [Cellulomonas denverensis]GIG27360.1 hypothetical protein Cde04nite_36040 [Cellulomonas denverensis]